MNFIETIRRSARRFSLAVAILLCLIVTGMAPNAAEGQFDSAAVLGTVKDSSGAIVAGATVTLTDLAKGVSVTATADENGDYQFPLVQVGQYKVTVAKTGFASVASDAFAVLVGARQRVDLALKEGTASDEVTVNGTANLLETDTSDRGETIQGQQAVELPLNGRAYADLATLVPGVHRSVIGYTSYPARDGSYNVNGLTSMDNNYQLDGIDNNAYQEANQGYSNQAMIPSPDALAEFKVETDNFPAEYGRAGGAIVNATTKSGSANFHGGVYDYLRNTALNAFGPFYGLGVKPTLVQNQYGATFGGPIPGTKNIFHDGFFFFVDYEALRSYAHVLTQAILPTAQQASGLFTSDATSTTAGATPIPLQNPYTGVQYPNGRIPLTDPNINPLAVNVLSLLPAPNIPGAALTANNFQYMGANTTIDDKGDGRVDFIRNSTQNGFFRYSQRAATFFIAPPFPGIAGGNSNGTLYGKTRQLAFGYNWTPTASSIIEFRYGQTWTNSGKQPVNLGAENLLADFNIPNAVTNPAYSGGLNTQIVSGFTQFGEQATNPQFTNPTTWDPKVNYSWIKGRHTFKVGYEFTWMDQAISDFHPKFGSDTYGGFFSLGSGVGQTAITKQAAGLADFLFGARNTYQINNIAEVNYERYWQMLYFQDDWKVTPKLTVNAGLRYEFFSPNFEQDNKILNYDPVNQRILHAGTGTDVNTVGSGGTSSYSLHYVGGSGLSNRALVDPDYKDFGPRIGLSYQIDPKTVLRAAYGLSYAPLFRFGGEGLLAYNGPDIITATVGSQAPSGMNGGEQLCVTQAGSLSASLTANPFTCFRRMQDGYETGFATAQNYKSTGAQTRYIPKNFATPYIQSYQLSVQRELPYGTTLEVAYVGVHGVKIPALEDFNQASLCPAADVTGSGGIGCSMGTQARRPISTFTNILTESNAGFLSYNALQTKLEHRFGHGLYLLDSFTLSRAINNSSADLEAPSGDAAVVNIANVAADRGPSGYNQPYNNTLSLVGDLPFGQGHAFLSDIHGWQQQLLGGWQITAINTDTSGLPLNILYNVQSSAAVSTTSSVYSVRPNQVGSNAAGYGTTFKKSNTGYVGYLNGANYAVPSANVLFGNTSRNSLRGPAFGQFDLGAHKNFGLGSETRTLQFRIEAFNVLNATNYLIPDTNFSDGANFGNFGAGLNYETPSRQVQGALRLSF